MDEIEESRLDMWLLCRQLSSETTYSFLGDEKAFKEWLKYYKVSRGYRNIVIVKDGWIRIFVEKGYMVEIQQYGNNINISEWGWIGNKWVEIGDTKLEEIVWR